MKNTIQKDKKYTYKGILSKNIKKAIDLAFSPDTGNEKYKNHIKVLILDKKGSHKPAYKYIRTDHAIEDLSKIIMCNNRDFYITANTYKGEVISEREFKAKKEQGLNTNLYITSSPKINLYKSSHCKKNLFSFKNIVIDVDWHNSSEKEIKAFSYMVIDNLDGYFEKKYMPNIVNFTGRGLQFWWCIKEESLQLQFLINNITKKLISTLNTAIDKNIWLPAETKVDETASLNNTGVFRLFGTKNTESSLSPETYILNEKKYTVDELKNALNINKQKKETGKKSTSIKKHNKNTFINRVKELEEIIRSNGGYVNNRHVKLHLLYNAMVTINDCKAKDKIMDINNEFQNPLNYNELLSIFNTIDRNGIYKYKNATIASKLGLEKFGNKYKNATKNRLEKLRNKTRNRKRIRNLLVCEEFAKTSSYKKAAKAGNVCINTAKKIITECADVVTSLIKKISYAKERKIFAYFLNHRHKRKQIKHLSEYNLAKKIILKYTEIRKNIILHFSPFSNEKKYLTLKEYLSLENQIITSRLFNYSSDEIHIAIAPALQIIR